MKVLIPYKPQSLGSAESSSSIGNSKMRSNWLRQNPLHNLINSILYEIVER